MILSIHNPKLKFTRQLLSRKKEREDAGKYVLEGIRLIEEAVTHNQKPEFVLYSSNTSNRGKKLIEEMVKQDVECLEVEHNILQRVSDTEQSQGILAVLPIIELAEPARPDFVLILDSIRDPGNMGTVLRSAASAGVQTVWVTTDTVDVYSPKVVRSAMGSHFQLPIKQKTWQQITDQTKALNLSMFLADSGGGMDCWDADFRSPSALVICNEAEGPSESARSLQANSIHIPMPGNFESLNAGVAASILLFEVVRQRRGL